jgi:RES domain-containing protein
MTLVAYRVDCEQVIDWSEAPVLAARGIAAHTLAGPWEDLASRGEVPPTWALAERLIGDGCSGIVVPSFAHGSVGDLSTAHIQHISLHIKNGKFNLRG